MTPSASPADLVQGGAEPAGEARDAGRHAGFAMRADVDVDVRRAPRRRHAQLVRQHRHGSRVKLRLRPGEIDEVRGVDDERPDAGGREALAEGGQLGRERRPAAPRGRVVGEHLDRGRADLDGAIGGPDHALAEREVGADPSAVGEHRREAYRRRMALHLHWRRGP